MGKLSAGFDLATELRAQRRASRLTQAALAAKADLAERTVRALEQGSGTLDSWHAALRALGLRLSGRNLPGGETLGLRLTTLRRRRGLSQEALAHSVGVSKPTLGALERDGKGRLSTLQRVLVVLGAGPYLAPREGSAAAFYTHAGNSSTHQAWETPAELLEALSLVFKRFDLDPCRLQEIAEPRAHRVNFTHEDDGLTLPWHGVVFVNPPYGRTLGLWVAKAHQEVEDGRARTVVALLPARPDTAYWHEHVAGRAVVYFLRGRLRFSDGEQAAPFPSALVVYGATPEIILALDHALPTAWRTK